ncbi:hypothetical protein [Pontibacter virosus]|uniref:hypothetical protein n=1 Tax=Pontibacter virosus TaxID=1765052 RepID=UPI000E300286|nr:hypothetical protein [Pontibacter virosus]
MQQEAYRGQINLEAALLLAKYFRAGTRTTFSQNEKKLSDIGKIETPGVKFIADNQLVATFGVFGKLLVICHVQQNCTKAPGRGGNQSGKLGEK